MFAPQSLCGFGEVQLDHFRRARAHKEQRANFRPARQQTVDDAVQLFVAIGHPGEIALFDDRRREARLSKDHHARRRLEKMRAGP